MHNLIFIIICVFSLSILNMGKNKAAGQALKNLFKPDTEQTSSSSFFIGEKEVRDTSFSLPIRVLDDPVGFMRTITDIQMLNRGNRKPFNYFDKLLYGDGFLRHICKSILKSKKDPVYLLERMTCGGEVLYYDLSLKDRKKGDFTTYTLIDDKMSEGLRSIHESLQKIIIEWDIDSLLNINEKPNRIVTDVSLHYGCAIRFRCDHDSVHIDMAKFYMWPFDYPYYLDAKSKPEDQKEDIYEPQRMSIEYDTKALTK